MLNPSSQPQPARGVPGRNFSELRHPAHIGLTARQLHHYSAWPQLSTITAPLVGHSGFQFCPRDIAARGGRLDSYLAPPRLQVTHRMISYLSLSIAKPRVQGSVSLVGSPSSQPQDLV